MEIGIVYLLCEMSDDERFKVGVTNRDIYKRLAELKTGNSHDIHLVNKFESIHYKKIEKWLHRRYHQFKVNEGGTEWFNLPFNEIVNFENSCKEIEETIIFMIENNNFYK